MILNVGCGFKLVKGAVNVDVTQYPGVDQVVDLTKFPWPWEDNSIDGIHASHIIEHFPDQKVFIDECYRILKPGGFLRLCVPHSSSCAGIGCMGHYRTYSYGTFRDYLSRDFYMFKVKKFTTTLQRLNWWYEATDCAGRLNPITVFLLRFFNPIFNFLAKLSPGICENLWCFWVGGFREVVWEGKKV